jgi:integrase/uncharacterized Zn finger protein (UPF0148 family)
MAPTDDPSGYREKFENELRRLRDLNYEDDAAAIRTWANRMTGEYSTRANQVNRVRVLSRRAAAGGYVPLTEMSNAAAFYDLHDSLRDGTNPDVKDDGLAESTLRNLRNATKRFFDDGLDRDWAADITVGGPHATKVTEDDIFVADEVEALFDAARNPRDKALMAVLLATGLRLTATLSLELHDVDLSGPTGTVTVRPEVVGNKRFAGERPILWATEYLKNWLDVHPVKDDPHAPVFCHVKDQMAAENRGDESDPDPRRIFDTEPITPWGMQQQLRRIRDRAVDLHGLREGKPVNPHNFRHSAITRMVRDGLSDQRIKWMVGWDEDSTQLKRYSHLTDDEMLAGVLEHYDVETSESTIGKPTLDTCPSCGAALSNWVNPKACPGCGVVLSDTAYEMREAAEDVTETTKDDLVAEASSEDADPTLTETLAKAVRDFDGSTEELASVLESLDNGGDRNN